MITKAIYCYWQNQWNQNYSINVLLFHVFFFADDILLFCEGSLSNVSSLQEILDKFSNMSSQIINYHKSSIFFSNNVSLHIREDIKPVFNVPDMKHSYPYLGNCIFRGEAQKAFNISHIDKMTNRLKGWKSKTLSHAGRSILINSTLASMPIYSMPAISLPDHICSSLNRIQRDFWWGYESNTRHCYLTTWKKIYETISKGGLGIRDSELVNSSSILKLIWRFMHEQNVF